MTTPEEARKICKEWGLGIKCGDGSYILSDSDNTIFDLIERNIGMKNEISRLKEKIQQKNQRIQDLLIDSAI